MTVLLLLVAILAAAWILREPELRRRIAAAVLRGQGTARAAFGLSQPRDLQRQALALVKEKALVSIGYAHLPTDVTVLLNPDDLTGLGATSGHVASELEGQIAELDGANAGGAVVFLLGARPQVKLAPDPRVQSGAVKVRTAWLEGTIAVTALAERDAQPPTEGPWLRIEVDGEDAGQAALAGRMIVGRSPRCDIPVNHPGVSREHAAIEVRGPGEVAITDLESRNGVVLADGSRVRAGQAVSLRLGEAALLGKHVRVELVSDRTEIMPTDGASGLAE